MIIPAREPKLLLVRQPDHARMSGRIALRWRRPVWLPPGAWKRFRNAVERHDEGWISEEARPALDSRGFPHDFLSLPLTRHLAVWRRSIKLAGQVDSYAGLLVAQHARWLTGMSQRRAAAGDRREIDRFLKEVEGEIDGWRRALESGTAEERALAASPNLSRARRLFSFFDSITLRLLGAIGMETTEPVPFGKREERLHLDGAGAKLFIRPWPFRAPAFRVEVKALELEAGPFRDPKSLAVRMARARRKALRWELTG